jgi:hypothetical protein
VKTQKGISYRIRRYIRESPEFLPQAATTSRALAMHVLGTNRGSTICIFHQRHRAFSQHDGYDGKFLMKGVTYPKKLNTLKVTHTPQPGHLHCGCNIDVALMGFFFWKTWTLTSSHPSLINQKTSYLTIDDMYSNNWGLEQINITNRLEGLPEKRLMDVVT